MRRILAIFLPFILFFTIGKPFRGLLSFILQLTLIGWIPAAIWATYSLSIWKTDQKLKHIPRSAFRTAKEQLDELNIRS